VIFEFKTQNDALAIEKAKRSYLPLPTSISITKLKKQQKKHCAFLK
jgi:hypothetical protein